MSLNEDHGNVYIIVLLLFPEGRLLVRELFCCLVEFGDRWLLTEVAADVRPFRELDMLRVRQRSR